MLNCDYFTLGMLVLFVPTNLYVLTVFPVDKVEFT